jgi:hydrogenase small subunit
MSEIPSNFGDFLNERKVTRRGLFKFAGVMAAALALPSQYVEVIANALAAAPRLPVVWLELQDCTGDTESFLRSTARPDPLQAGKTDPSLTDLLFDFLSIDYQETVMVAAGEASAKCLSDTLAKYPGEFICVVEGSIPMAQNGVFCTIGGRTALSIIQDVAPKAKAVIAIGSCAWDGGLSAAAPNPTGAVGVGQAVPGLTTLINLPGCPSNTVNLVATLVYYLTFKQWPPVDSRYKRPIFAYGREIHENCERKDHYEAERFVQAWGDAGHKAGYCLFKMGCRGPVTNSNCNRVLWNAGSQFPKGTSWPVASGHGCIGCSTAKFWDNRTPFYTPLADD